MAGVTFGDELVRDYLVYRGFLSALKSFDAEVKTDRDRGFRPDRIVEHLSTCINNLDLNALREAWSHLDQRVFSRLEHSFLGTARKLENALLRMYVVTCIATGRHDKLLDFFEKLTPELQGQSEWKEWFALPFLKNPEENPTFSVFFTRQWQDTMLVSLHNFISVVFQSVATPMLLNYEEELFRHNALQEENEILKGKLSAMQLGESEPHKNGSENDFQEIAAPAELMDDFYVIAQEVPVENQSRSIKTLIRNISSGLPTSPILGRRHQSQDGSRRQDDFSSVGGSKSSKLKPRSPSVPPHSSSALISECTKLKQEFENLNRPSSAKDESTSPDIGTKFSCGKIQPLLQLPCSSISSVSNPKGGFLLLSQEEFTEHNSYITHCKFNSSGSVVASADMDGVIKIWTTSPSPHTLSTIMSKSSVLALEWGSKRERLLLHGGVAGHVRLYDTKERKIIGDVSVDISSSLNNLRIMCLACSPTESCFVASTSIQGSNSVQGHLYTWDMRTLQMEHCLPISMCNSFAYCCSFNHNGQLLLAGTSDGKVYIFDMRTSEVIATWTAHASEVFTAQFSIDETTCYTMGGDGKFIQWSVNKTGQRIGELDIHSGATGPFTSNSDSSIQQYNPVGKLFAFNNDGSHILTCGPTGGVIYKVSRSSLTHEVNIGGHSQAVNTVDWSTAMECSTCLTGSIDGRISVSTLLAH